MKNLRFGLLILIAFFVTENLVRADDCVCAQMPMYQVPGGWFHAGAVFNLPSSAGLPCTFQYTTGVVLSSQHYNDTCKYSPACGTCTALGDEASPPDDMSYKCPVPKYSDVSDPARFKSFLEAIYGSYSDFSYSNPRVLRLKRPAPGGSATDFYALIMTATFTPANPRPSGIVGIEIQDAGPAQIDIYSQCLAVHSGKVYKQKPMKGLLQVEFGSREVGFILLNCDSNKDVKYDPCRVQKTVMSTMCSQPAPVSCVVPNQCQSGIGACLPQCCSSRKARGLLRRGRCR